MRAGALGWLFWAAAVIVAVLFFVCFLEIQKAEARPFSGDFQCSHPDIPDEFDWAFAAAARRHMPVYFRDEKGACILKAICWIESRLNPDAVSVVGAQGLCQVMPATAADLERRNIWRGNIRSAKDNAMASAAVYNSMWSIWTTPRSFECRHELATASYNAGGGNIVKAQTAAHGARCWERIRAALPEITGRHARETIDYVSRFWAAWRKLRGHGL